MMMIFLWRKLLVDPYKEEVELKNKNEFLEKFKNPKDPETTLEESTA